MKWKAGDRVVVRSKEEILATLDSNGRHEGLPFMPQMFDYCGKSFVIYRSAHKTCDTATRTGGRRLENAVHLDLRCDGRAYGGCQAACLIFWKTHWLRAPDEKAEEPTASSSSDAQGCRVQDVLRSTTRSIRTDTEDEVVYSCQATQLPEYTTPLPWYDFRQYIGDLTSGNVSLGFQLRGLVYFLYRELVMHSFWRLRLLLISLYDRFQTIRGGPPYPQKSGTVPKGTATPDPPTLGVLEVGDLVRVKSYDDIRATLDGRNQNRGMRFDAEMVPYCGNVYRIQARVEKFLDESSGRMIHLKRPSYILEGVTCQSCYSENRFGCPRSIYSWWREIWLQKVSEPAPASAIVAECPGEQSRAAIARNGEAVDS